MSETRLECDLLVIGAGMAGLSAAAYAARAGARVTVVEKSDAIGGSALLSGGGLWTATSAEAFQELDPGVEGDLIKLLVDRFSAAVAWVESLGVAVSDPIALDAIQGYPSVARVIDNLAYLERCRAAVEQAGGVVATATTVTALIMDGNAVRGATVRDRDGEVDIHAPWTLLATGGFQGDPDLRSRYIGEHARELLVRSNSASTGDGLLLARAAGAQLRTETDTFYGHLVPTPLEHGLQPQAFLRLAQLYSPRALLLDQDGNRIVDESLSYYGNAVAVSRIPGRRALLVGDQAIRDYDRTAYRGAEQVDRPTEAAREGAHVAEADSLDGLEPQIAVWGYSGVAQCVGRFNEMLVDAPDALDPPRRGNRSGLSTPPFFAIEVQPAITFPFGGIRVDTHARVLDEHGHQPVPGLLAAGVDASIYHSLYAGGLAFSLVLGLQAAETALANPRHVLAAPHERSGVSP